MRRAVPCLRWMIRYDRKFMYCVHCQHFRHNYEQWQQSSCLTDRCTAPRPPLPPLQLCHQPSLAMQFTFNCTHSHIIGQLGSAWLGFGVMSIVMGLASAQLRSTGANVSIRFIISSCSSGLSIFSYSQLGCSWARCRCLHAAHWAHVH